MNKTGYIFNTMRETIEALKKKEIDQKDANIISKLCKEGNNALRLELEAAHFISRNSNNIVHLQNSGLLDYAKNTDTNEME